jgi:molybdopterin molybdotransferase
MRGFPSRVDVERVVAWVDALPAPGGAEDVPLADAAGRVLAADVVAGVDVPPFRRASMDGWALHAEATFGATEAEPLLLQVVGRALPGRPWEPRVPPGSAVRIMTGAPVPEGCDAVLAAEWGEESAGKLAARAAVTPGRNVGDRGEDVHRGEAVPPRGRRLRPQDVGLLSALGRPHVSCVRRPTVRVVVTGSELLPPGSPPAGARLPDSNSPMLSALVRRDGGLPSVGGIVPDDPAQLEAELLSANEDVLLVSGGSSVGEEDHAPGLLARHGSLDVHGVAMRPSSPAGAGRLRGRPVFLLPGNPVSCLCAYDFFAGRAVRRLAGLPSDWPYVRRTLPLAERISSALGRLDYVRVRVEDGRVHPLMARGASILSSTTAASGFVLVPKDLEGYPEGAEVVVHLYD